MAAYYHPTNVVIVDDNKRFLNSICFDLDESIAYRLFDKPEKALHFLKREYKFNPLINRCLMASGDANIHLGKL